MPRHHHLLLRLLGGIHGSPGIRSLQVLAALQDDIAHAVVVRVSSCTDLLAVVCLLRLLFTDHPRVFEQAVVGRLHTEGGQVVDLLAGLQHLRALALLLDWVRLVLDEDLRVAGLRYLLLELEIGLLQHLLLVMILRFAPVGGVDLRAAAVRVEHCGAGALHIVVGHLLRVGVVVDVEVLRILLVLHEAGPLTVQEIARSLVPFVLLQWGLLLQHPDAVNAFILDVLAQLALEHSLLGVE